MADDDIIRPGDVHDAVVGGVLVVGPYVPNVMPYVIRADVVKRDNQDPPMRLQAAPVP